MTIGARTLTGGALLAPLSIYLMGVALGAWGAYLDARLGLALGGSLAIAAGLMLVRSCESRFTCGRSVVYLPDTQGHRWSWVLLIVIVLALVLRYLAPPAVFLWFVWLPMAAMVLWGRGVKHLFTMPLAIAGLVFAFTGVFTMLWRMSGGPQELLTALELLLQVMLFLVSVHLVRRPRAEPFLLALVLGLCAMLLLIGAIRFQDFPSELLDLTVLQGWVPNRLSAWAAYLPTDRGSEIHPNTIAGMLLWLIPYFFGARALHDQPQSGRKDAMSFLILLFLVLTTLMVFLTQSRGAYVSVLIVSAGLFLYWSGRLRLAVLVPLAMLTAFVSILVLDVSSVAHFFGLSESSALNVSSYQSRFSLRALGYELIRASPWAGVGAEQMTDVALNAFPELFPHWYTEIPHIHNQFIQMTMDHGMFGYVAYVMLLTVAFRMAWTTFHRVESPVERWYLVCMGGSVMSLLIWGLTDALVYGLATLFFWIQVSMLSVLHSRALCDRQSGRRDNAPRKYLPGRDNDTIRRRAWSVVR
jgi:hypothetical protein